MATIGTYLHLTDDDEVTYRRLNRGSVALNITRDASIFLTSAVQAENLLRAVAAAKDFLAEGETLAAAQDEADSIRQAADAGQGV